MHVITQLCLILIAGTNELAVVDRLSPTKAFVSFAPSRAEQKSGISGQFIVQYDVDRSEDAWGFNCKLINSKSFPYQIYNKSN